MLLLLSQLRMSLRSFARKVGTRLRGRKTAKCIQSFLLTSTMAGSSLLQFLAVEISAYCGQWHVLDVSVWWHELWRQGLKQRRISSSATCRGGQDNCHFLITCEHPRHSIQVTGSVQAINILQLWQNKSTKSFHLLPTFDSPPAIHTLPKWNLSLLKGMRVEFSVAFNDLTGAWGTCLTSPYVWTPKRIWNRKI